MTEQIHDTGKRIISCVLIKRNAEGAEESYRLIIIIILGLEGGLPFTLPAAFMYWPIT